MRSRARDRSDVSLVVARGEWSRIQTSDHYKGWVPSRQIRILLTGNGYAKSVPAVQVESLFANIYVEPDITKHKPVVTVPFETRLELVSDSKAKDGKPAPEGWLQVHLPDLRNAWVQAGVPGFRKSWNSSGRKTTTVGIPRTGLWWRKQEGGGRRRS